MVSRIVFQSLGKGNIRKKYLKIKDRKIKNMILELFNMRPIPNMLCSSGWRWCDVDYKGETYRLVYGEELVGGNSNRTREEWGRCEREWSITHWVETKDECRELENCDLLDLMNKIIERDFEYVNNELESNSRNFEKREDSIKNDIEEEILNIITTVKMI